MPLQQGAIAREWLCLEPRCALSAPFKTMFMVNCRKNPKKQVKVENEKLRTSYSFMSNFA